MAALATPGQGTLAAWGRLPPVVVKTGSIRQTVALAGYLETRAEPIVFVRFLNHRAAEAPALRAETAGWLWSLIAARGALTGD